MSVVNTGDVSDCKEEVRYFKYLYEYDGGSTFIYLFYLYDNAESEWMWNEHKLTLQEALTMYPKYKYDWVEEEG